MPSKQRLDVVLVERGLAQSRERARALILAGRVLVSEQKIDKPGSPVAADAAIRLLGQDLLYVSRGGLKLAAALDHWHIEVAGRACLDVGASTGGFTDCLLQHGAAHVTAVDTGFGQIAMKLRTDPRVRLMERTNARLLEPGRPRRRLRSLPSWSWMSPLSPPRWFLPPVLAAAPRSARLSSWSSRSLRLAASTSARAASFATPSAPARRRARRRMRAPRKAGRSSDTIASPITGAEGNQEFLLYAESAAPA